MYALNVGTTMARKSSRPKKNKLMNKKSVPLIDGALFFEPNRKVWHSSTTSFHTTQWCRKENHEVVEDRNPVITTVKKAHITFFHAAQWRRKGNHEVVEDRKPVITTVKSTHNLLSRSGGEVLFIRTTVLITNQQSLFRLKAVILILFPFALAFFYSIL
jgi:hypothetical protein